MIFINPNMCRNELPSSFEIALFFIVYRIKDRHMVKITVFQVCYGRQDRVKEAREYLKSINIAIFGHNFVFYVKTHQFVALANFALLINPHLNPFLPETLNISNGAGIFREAHNLLKTAK